MSNEGLIVLVAVLAAVQSVFGVGILIFGTPSLLLAGYRFDQVLFFLLPASITISLLQLVYDKNITLARCRMVASLIIPTLCIGLFIALNIPTPRIDLVVSAVLLITACIRSSQRYRMLLVDFARRHSKVMLGTIGFVHGLTNMGGSLLEAYASSIHSEKLAVRQNVALGYALLASIQLVSLAALGRLSLSNMSFQTALVAGLIYLTIGRKIFSIVTQVQYRALVSLLMLVAAAALVLKRALI